MMNNDEKMLALLLSRFGDRHNTLSRFLIEHGALNPAFLDKLREIGEPPPLPDNLRKPSDIRDYYDSLMKTGPNINELERLMFVALSDENYEEAARLRDRLNIRRKQ